MDYEEEVKKLVERRGTRLRVDVKHLRQFKPQLVHDLRQRPTAVLQAADDALAGAVDKADGKYLAQHPGLKLHVEVVGNLGGQYHVTPRTLLASLLNRLVRVEGIVTRCSLVRPKVQRSVHYCEATKQFTMRSYRDVTSNEGAPTGAVYPTRDDDGNLLTTEYGLCEYKDSQTVTVQEAPEDSAPGSMPRSINIICEGALADQCKPGDRVQIVGVYKSAPVRAKGVMDGIFRTVLVANSIEMSNKEVADPISSMRGADIRKIRALSKRKDVFDVLARSVAPSIYGHDNIKKAALLMLLGGVEKNLKNGTHIRGDMNVLVVGDPGVAKSQLLRAVMGISPLAISTTGRGTSGAGLTAAVLQDRDTGERRLEAGAMVLGDRGVVCIDEFDKMSEADRVAIHEVMEQQTVTIAKAGIHTTLNARCSVFAAANPVMGMYDHNQSVAKNLALPDSLLSRFDLLFIALDKMTQRMDRSISEHVLRMHQVPPLDEGVGLLASVVQGEGADGATPMFLSKDIDVENIERSLVEMLGPDGGARRRRGGSGGQQQNYLNTQFLRMYIAYAKQRITPELTSSARNRVAAHYVDMRQTATPDSKPVTVRTLETFIRIATAHAKMCLRTEVTADDVDVALGLMLQSTGADAERPGQKRRRKPAGGGGDDAAGDDDDDDGGDGGARTPKPKSARKKKAAPRREAEAGSPPDEELDLDTQPTPTAPAAADLADVAVTPEQEQAVRGALSDFMKYGTMVDFAVLAEHLEGKVGPVVIRKVLEQMAEQGQVMVDGDMETGLSIFIIAP